MVDDGLSRTQKTRLNPADQDKTLSDSDRVIHAGTLPRPAIADVELGDEIGRGGMGVVYRGKQSYIDRRVAVKLLLVDKAGGDEYVRRFQREAKILAGLAHPHIVACYQAGVTGEGNPYLVMEYIDGPNLRDWINLHGAMPERQALAMARDLAHALEHANGQGIIHRDVKPENVLLQKRDQAAPGDPFPYQVKLVDLGLARPARTGGEHSLTLQGVVMGTPATMAPEQFEDPDNVDFRADIYGLGCVLYHALTGRPAFASNTLAQIVTTKINGEPPDPSREVAGLGQGVNTLVRDLLARDKQRRPQSYRELIARCDAALAGASGTGRGRAPAAWIAVAAVAVAAVAAWVWLAGGGGAQAPRGVPPAAVAPAATAAVASPAPAATSPATPVETPAKAPTLGDPAPLFHIGEWTKAGQAQWDASENIENALAGVAGEIAHPLEPRPWEIAGTLRLSNAEDLKTDVAAIGVVGADGSRCYVQVSNLAGAFALLVEKSDPQGERTPIHSDGFKPRDVQVVLRHVREQFLELTIDGVPLEHAVGLAPAALPIKAVFLRAKGKGPVDVQNLAIRYAKP
jgi:predicted Ser/Thr protein kinase